MQARTGVGVGRVPGQLELGTADWRVRFGTLELVDVDRQTMRLPHSVNL